MVSARWCVVCAACLCLVIEGRAGAQIGSAQIAGAVTDAAGAGVPGATVVAVHLRSGASRHAVSNRSGLYAVAGLAPGEYRVDVALSGFRPVRRQGLRLETGETARLDVELVVGAVSELITVTADAPVQRATASLGQVITEEKIASLPLNGRTFITLAALAPGVALPPASQLPRINGGRPRTNEYLFDGISVLQPEPGQVAYFPTIDAIQEFKLETNSPPAEFGRFNGGVINLTTKSGTNAVRGSAFEFFRHESLNARNVFAPSGARPEFRRNQFGGVVGGPIRRDRTFFFVDYQGQRQTIARTVISTVPTALQRQGIFSEPIGGRVPVVYDPATGGTTRTPFAGGAIPADRIDPVALSLLQRYPQPTSTGTASNFRRTGPETDDQDQWTARIDHRWASGRDSLFGRLTNFRGMFIPVTPLPDGSGVTTGTLGPQDTVSWALASRYQRALSANVLNEVRFGDTRRTVGRTASQLAGAAGVTLNIPGIPPTARFPNTLPTFLIAGYQQLGSPPNTATNFNTSVTELADTLTWVTGRHTVKAGFDWRWQRLNVIQPPSPTGAFTFNAIGSDLPGTANTGTPLASFLLGQVQAFSIDLQQDEIRERASFQEYFIQDDWRINDRLTISPGLRYTLNFPSTEINGQTAILNLQTALLEYPRDQPVRPLKRNNFGPRLGILAAAESVRRSAVAGRRAVDDAMVQHRRLRHRAAVHDRVVQPEPGSWPGISQRRSGSQPPGAHRRRHSDRVAGRSVQPAQYAATRQPERCCRIGGVRHHHHGWGSPCRSTCGEVAVLTLMPDTGRVPLYRVADACASEMAYLCRHPRLVKFRQGTGPCQSARVCLRSSLSIRSWGRGGLEGWSPDRSGHPGRDSARRLGHRPPERHSRSPRA